MCEFPMTQRAILVTFLRQKCYKKNNKLRKQQINHQSNAIAHLNIRDCITRERNSLLLLVMVITSHYNKLPIRDMMSHDVSRHRIFRYVHYAHIIMCVRAKRARLCNFALGGSSIDFVRRRYGGAPFLQIARTIRRLCPVASIFCRVMIKKKLKQNFFSILCSVTLRSRFYRSCQQCYKKNILSVMLRL